MKVKHIKYNIVAEVLKHRGRTQYLVGYSHSYTVQDFTTGKLSTINGIKEMIWNIKDTIIISQ